MADEELSNDNAFATRLIVSRSKNGMKIIKCGRHGAAVRNIKKDFQPNISS